MLTDFDDSLKDISLVIAGYIYDGETVKYVQANGMSDTVYGITYNEAKQAKQAKQANGLQWNFGFAKVKSGILPGEIASQWNFCTQGAKVIS